MCNLLALLRLPAFTCFLGLAVDFEDEADDFGDSGRGSRNNLLIAVACRLVAAVSLQ